MWFSIVGAALATSIVTSVQATSTTPILSFPYPMTGSAAAPTLSSVIAPPLGTSTPINIASAFKTTLIKLHSAIEILVQVRTKIEPLADQTRAHIDDLRALVPPADYDLARHLAHLKYNALVYKDTVQSNQGHAVRRANSIDAPMSRVFEMVRAGNQAGGLADMEPLGLAVGYMEGLIISSCAAYRDMLNLAESVTPGFDRHLWGLDSDTPLRDADAAVTVILGY